MRGSSPPSVIAEIIRQYGQVSIAAIAADCKSATQAVNTVGSSPTLPTTQCVAPFYAPEAILVTLACVAPEGAIHTVIYSVA